MTADQWRDDHLPFRCGRCGRFVKQWRVGDTGDDFGPAPCINCPKLAAREAR